MRAGHTRLHRGYRNDVFRICRNSMPVKVETITFAFGRDSQDSDGVNDVHHDQPDSQRGHGNNGAADDLGCEHRRSAAVKQSGEGRGIVTVSYTHLTLPTSDL